MTTVTCTHCNATSPIPAEFVGRKVHCKKCNGLFKAAPPAPAALGRYQVREQVRQAAFGPVYQAYDPQKQCDVLLALLQPTAHAAPESARRLTQRVGAAARLSHPNVLPVFRAAAEGSGYLVAAAWVEGRTLGSVQTKGGLEPRRAVYLASQLADALAFAHQNGVVHGNLQPGSVLVDSGDHVYLMDLGIAGWDAPPGAREPAAAQDVYAAAVLLYQLLTGRRPFEQPGAAKGGPPPAPSRLRPGLDLHLDTICLQALDPDPAQRFTDAAEFAEALRGWLTDPARAAAPAVAPGGGEGMMAETALPPDSQATHVAVPASVQPVPLAAPAATLTPASRPPSLPPSSGAPTMVAVPVEQALAPAGGGQRPVTLACLLASAVILCSSAGLAGWHLLHPVSNAPEVAPASGDAAEVYAGVEIGSTGVKGVVAAVRPDPELGYNFDRVWTPKFGNPSLVTGMERTGRFDPEALRDAVRDVAAFCAKVRAEHGLPPGRLHVVAGSGLFSAVKDKPARIAENQAALADAVRQATGLEVQFVTAEREADLGLSTVVPPKFSGVALSIDVGGGNTKVAYREVDGRLVSGELKYGTKTFRDEARKAAGGDPTKLAAKAELLRDQLLVPGLSRLSERRSGLLNRERVYLYGGIVWAMATALHPEATGRYVELSARDIEDFHAQLRESSGKLPRAALERLGGPLREEMEAEWNRVRDVFQPDDLVAGSELLRAVSRAYGLGSGRKLYFPRFGVVGWLLSYLGEEAMRHRAAPASELR
jgi:hypothetical protein